MRRRRNPSGASHACQGDLLKRRRALCLRAFVKATLRVNCSQNEARACASSIAEPTDVVVCQHRVLVRAPS